MLDSEWHWPATVEANITVDILRGITDEDGDAAEDGMDLDHPAGGGGGGGRSGIVFGGGGIRRGDSGAMGGSAGNMTARAQLVLYSMPQVIRFEKRAELFQGLLQADWSEHRSEWGGGSTTVRIRRGVEVEDAQSSFEAIVAEGPGRLTARYAHARLANYQG